MSVTPPDAGRATLLRAIQIEARNAGLYDSQAQLFQGYDEPVTDIFREMTEEERQHGTEMEQRYRERCGSVPAPTEEPKVYRELAEFEETHVRLFQEKLAEKRRAPDSTAR